VLSYKLAALVIGAVLWWESRDARGILVITGGSSMAAMIFEVPSHCGHCSLEIAHRNRYWKNNPRKTRS